MSANDASSLRVERAWAYITAQNERMIGVVMPVACFTSETTARFLMVGWLVGA